jgi:hypothetical protein
VMFLLNAIQCSSSNGQEFSIVLPVVLMAS